MAAGAFTIYNKAKKKIGNAEISLGSGNFRWTLHTSASNAGTATLSAYGSVTNEVAEGNGYSSSGKAFASRVWTVGASAGQYKFNASSVFWSGNGGTISNIKFLVISLSAASAAGRHLICRSQLSTSQFNLATGNRLTITPNASGIFTMA